MIGKPRPVQVADLLDGLFDPAWDTPAVRAVLTLFDDDALADATVTLTARISQLMAAADEDQLDMRSPLPELIRLPVQTLGEIFQLPFVVAVGAARRPDDEDEICEDGSGMQVGGPGDTPGST